ncbi:MAG: hypothetical protein FJ319_06620 [SAR202 cluster bacterium]|nr:hypothetical protein [SAR202 cluster bacterium]
MSPGGHSPSYKVIAAVMAAVQAYIDQESAPRRVLRASAIPPEAAPVSQWKAARWGVYSSSAGSGRPDPWRSPGA